MILNPINELSKQYDLIFHSQLEKKDLLKFYHKYGALRKSHFEKGLGEFTNSSMIGVELNPNLKATYAKF